MEAGRAARCELAAARGSRLGHQARARRRDLAGDAGTGRGHRALAACGPREGERCVAETPPTLFGERRARARTRCPVEAESLSRTRAGELSLGRGPICGFCAQPRGFVSAPAASLAAPGPL